MIKRFFKLLYTLSIILLALSLPVFIFISTYLNKVSSSYKARCLLNNQYVVLQGASVGESYEFYLNDIENDKKTKELLNFYCKYYNEIQPYIIAYNEAKTLDDQVLANMSFVEFKNTKDEISAYPKLYKLEIISNKTFFKEILELIVVWFIWATPIFIVLQILRVCYVYVVFGVVMWHPFKQIKNIK